MKESKSVHLPSITHWLTHGKGIAANFVCIALLLVSASGLTGCASQSQVQTFKCEPSENLSYCLEADLHSYLVYPRIAEETGAEGIALVEISIDQTGEISNPRIVKSSGHSVLDQEAVIVWSRMMKDGLRFPWTQVPTPAISNIEALQQVVFCLTKDCLEEAEALMERQTQAEYLYKTADSSLRDGRLDQAIEADTKAITLFPFAGYYVNRGWAYYLSRQPSAAQKDFEAAIGIDPSSVWAYNDLGLIYRDNGEYDKAVANFTKSIQYSSGFFLAYCNRADAYTKLGQMDLAIADYTEMIKLSPTSLIAYNDRAWAYHLSGHGEKGLADADKAIELSPTDAAAFDTRAHIYEDMGQRGKALADYQTSLKFRPDKIETKEALNRLLQKPSG